MTVFIFTSFNVFGNEKVLFASMSRKAGEKKLRQMYPHMKADGPNSYRLDAKHMVFDRETTLLGRVIETEVV